MIIKPIFAIGIGKATDTENLPVARNIFVENQELFKFAGGKKLFRTTLKNYSPGYIDHLEYKNKEAIEQIKESIRKKAIDYLTICGYRTDALQVKVPNIWLNEMKKNCAHENHMHYGYTLSGCYYVDVPKNSGKIVFNDINKVDCCNTLSINEYTPYNSGCWSFAPEEGDMFFWKSTLQHEVPPSNFEGIRRSIAFDVLVTGT
jgi:uncharacterized protein (TIGR02466 family)